MSNEWSDIDFAPGVLSYIETRKQEDMLQVFFSPSYILDMGWYGSRYEICIVRDYKWDEPVCSDETCDETKLKSLLLDYKERAIRLSDQDDREVLKACLASFPQCRDLVAEHMYNFGELLQHVFYPEVINDPLIDLLEINKDVDKIKKYCDFIELMWRQKDDSIRNVVDVSILERLSDDSEIWQRFGAYISYDFKQYINTVAIPENLSSFNVKELL